MHVRTVVLVATIVVATTTGAAANQPPNALMEVSWDPSFDDPVTNDPVDFFGGFSVDEDGTIVSYAWQFGDGTTASGVDVEHVYEDPGTYTVTLTVTDDDGATDTATRTITVENPPPTAAIEHTPTEPTTGEAVDFTAIFDDPNHNVIGFHWDFGDGTTAGGVSPTHTYADDGTYTVTLAVLDDDGALGEATTEVTVRNVPPAPDFDWQPTEPTPLDTISFDGTLATDPDGSVVAYEWRFGDETTATGPTPTHSFADDGTYPVTLTVTDDDGATASITREVTVENVPPTGDFTWQPDPPVQGEPTTFDAGPSTDPDGEVAEYTRKFPDGSIKRGETATYTFPDAGFYPVLLRIADDDGDGDYITKEVKVPNRAPTAAFDVAPAEPEIGETVAFDGSRSADPDGSLAAYAWTFGDGTTATGPTPTHEYATAGDYPVTLTVTDDDGSTATATETVTVVAFDGPLVPGADDAPTDQDGDGTYEDVDGDGTVDGEDVAAMAELIRAYLRGDISLTPAQIAALDFDGDGDLDRKDLAALAKQVGKGKGP